MLPSSILFPVSFINTWNQVVCRADLRHYLFKELKEPKQSKNNVRGKSSQDEPFALWGCLATTFSMSAGKEQPNETLLEGCQHPNICLQGGWRWIQWDPLKEQQACLLNIMHTHSQQRSFLFFGSFLINHTFSEFSCVQFMSHGHVLKNFK